MMNYKQRFTSILILSLLMLVFALSPARADDDPDTFQIYGILEEGAFPAPPGDGNWTIDGITYTADSDTEFETEHGEFTAGTCVEVKYFTTEGVNYAKEIETEHDYKCSGDSSAYSETYGIVINFPDPGLIGDWIIDGITYKADVNTQFEQEHGSFFVRGCVEVKYIDDGSNKTAIEIEPKSSDDCDGEAQDKFYGLIEVFPENLTDYNSTWLIGGMEFDFDSDTNLDQNNAKFAENVCVEVKYYVHAKNTNIATKIKSKNAHHCSKGSFTQIVYGFITEEIPKDIYGTWWINDNDYVASESTQFKENVRKFTVGQCVKVRYYTLVDVNHAVEIKTEPDKKCDGSGDGLPGVNQIYATIDSFPWPAESYNLPYIGPWIIGGIPFEATPTTLFIQDHGSFAVRACVKAKYTTSDDGLNTLIEVATQEETKCENDGDPHPSALVFTTYGAVVSKPESVDLTGDWKINGASYIAGDFTNFSEEFGEFGVGAHVKVKYVLVTNNDMEIELLPLTIETHVAPGAGLINLQGTLTSHDSSDEVNDWVVDGVPYTADSVINVGTNDQSPQVGEWVMLNTYEIKGSQYVTSIQAPYYLFQPLISP